MALAVLLSAPELHWKALDEVSGLRNLLLLLTAPCVDGATKGGCHAGLAKVQRGSQT